MKKVLLCMAVLFLSTAAFAEGQGEAPQGEDNVVRVFGAFRGEEALRFEECLKSFEAETGIDVIYEGSPEFETQIMVQAAAGTPPDVAALPQPGLMKNFAAQDMLVPLWPEILEMIERNYTPAWKDLGAHEGIVYGVFHRVNGKSFVFYPKKAFEAKGYEIPRTWDELHMLMDQIVADGGTPWAIGMESGGATGWVATDWMEDIMLRTAGPEVYDQWVNHDIPFDHPAVREAAEIMGSIWMNEEYTYGGAMNILTEDFKIAPQHLFEGGMNPKAYLHRQGNFALGFLQEEIMQNMEEEVGVFALPSINPEFGTPVLGGGDQFVVFNDRPEVRAFMEFLTTWESAAPWARIGGALFPHQDQNFDDYGSKLESELAKILVNAEVFRFDASDLMPGEVGAGSFWTGMSEYVSGVDLDRVLSNIEKSWPE